MGDAIGGQLVQFGCGQSRQVVGNAAADGRGDGKTEPGAQRQRQPFQSGEAANEREIVQAVRLQSAPGVRDLLLPQGREKLAGRRPVSRRLSGRSV